MSSLRLSCYIFENAALKTQAMEDVNRYRRKGVRYVEFDKNRYGAGEGGFQKIFDLSSKKGKVVVDLADKHIILRKSGEPLHDPEIDSLLKMIKEFIPEFGDYNVVVKQLPNPSNGYSKLISLGVSINDLFTTKQLLMDITEGIEIGFSNESSELHSMFEFMGARQETQKVGIIEFGLNIKLEEAPRKIEFRVMMTQEPVDGMYTVRIESNPDPFIEDGDFLLKQFSDKVNLFSAVEWSKTDAYGAKIGPYLRKLNKHIMILEEHPEQPFADLVARQFESNGFQIYKRTRFSSAISDIATLTSLVVSASPGVSSKKVLEETPRTYISFKYDLRTRELSVEINSTRTIFSETLKDPTGEEVAVRERLSKVISDFINR